MKRVILASSLVLLLLFTGYRCFRSDLSPYHKLSIRIAHETTEKLKTTIPSLHFGGWGGRDQVVYMGLEMNHEINLDSGRNLILQISHTYLDAFNSNKKLRPFIRDYPFTIQNLHIDIFFHNPDRSDISDGKISIISINDGIVRYNGHSPDIRLLNGRGRLITMHKETYEEAIQASMVKKV